MEIIGLIPEKELNTYIEKANYIITHGGVSSIITSVKFGKKVIAVPRLKKYNEHVNDHQLQIIENFDAEGYIKGIEDISQLKKAIEELETFEPVKYQSGTGKIKQIIENYIKGEV